MRIGLEWNAEAEDGIELSRAMRRLGVIVRFFFRWFMRL